MARDVVRAGLGIRQGIVVEGRRHVRGALHDVGRALPPRGFVALSAVTGSSRYFAMQRPSTKPSSIAMFPPWPRNGSMAWQESPSRLTRPTDHFGSGSRRNNPHL